VSRGDHRTIGIALLIALFPSSVALALDPGRHILQYGHNRWGAAEGFAHSAHTVLQTRDAYLWVGTGDGLFRFNGVDFERVALARPEPESVFALHEDAEGRLWVGLMSGLARLEQGRLTITYGEREGLPPGSVYALASTSDGTLWAGTDAGLFSLTNGRFTRERLCPGDSTHRVRALTVARDGALWVGATRGGALRRLSAREGTCRVFGVSDGLLDPTVVAVHEDASRTLWVGTERGLGALRDGRFTFFTTRDGLSHDTVRSLASDRDGNLWIGTTAGGLNRFRDGVFSSLTARDGLVGDRIFQLYEDREGILWVATRGGLERLQDGAFRPLVLPAPHGILRASVRTIVGSSDGAVWIGTEGQGLLRLRGNDLRVFTAADGLPEDMVTSLLAMPDGALWIGTTRGLVVYEHGRFRRVGAAEGLTHDNVRVLLRDRAGAIWIGTEGGGLFHGDGRRFAGRLSDVTVFALHEDRGGVLWAGTARGLRRLEKGRESTFTADDGLASSLVLGFAEDPDGTLWIGTGNGVSRRRGERIVSYTARQGFVDERLYGIFDDGRGRLWITSGAGVYRVAKQAFDDFDAGRTSAVEFTHYTTADGLPSPDCSGLRQPVGWVAPDGALWVPTLRGIGIVDPRRDARPETPMPVVIERLVVNGAPTGGGDGLRLGPGVRSLELGWAGLSLRAPPRNRFKYRLEGYETDWVDSGSRRAAYYTQVPPGTYRFRVSGRSGDGPWNEVGASFAFSVAPRFHQTVAFQLLVAAGVVSLAAGLHRLRLRQLRAQLAAVLAERSRIARELHDTLDQGLTGASIQLQLAHRHIREAPDEAAEHLGRARELVASTFAEGRRAIWALRSQALEDDQAGLPDAFARLAREMSAGTATAVRVDVRGRPRPLPPLVEGHVLRIGQEALTNAVRHGEPREVILALEFDAPGLVLSVRDDGRGFDRAATSSGLGLRGMEERASAIGGALSVTSRPGKGTEVRLKVP
jgi:ligand-binding sensor domain-containing protein/signal transduction histidine kinase